MKHHTIFDSNSPFPMFSSLLPSLIMMMISFWVPPYHNGFDIVRWEKRWKWQTFSCLKMLMMSHNNNIRIDRKWLRKYIRTQHRRWKTIWFFLLKHSHFLVCLKLSTFAFLTSNFHLFALRIKTKTDCYILLSSSQSSFNLCRLSI